MFYLYTSIEEYLRLLAVGIAEELNLMVVQLIDAKPYLRNIRRTGEGMKEIEEVKRVGVLD